MNKKVTNALLEASDATELLLRRLKDHPLDEMVDIAARLRAVVKNCEAIDKAIKDEIKKKLKHKNGVVLGDVFKANLQVVDTVRFDSTAFKEAEPDLYEQYSKHSDQERITFEPR